MAEVPPTGMAQVIPYLFCRDVPAAYEWLSLAFGFEQLMLAPITATRHHAELRFGRGVIMLGTAADEYGTTAPRDSARTHGTFVYLDDVDGHHARAREAGAEIVEAPVDRDYGRSYWARDLDGHDWFFTRPPRSGKD